MSVPLLRLADLEADPKFKPAVLRELKASRRTTLDLRPLLRDYIQGLAVAPQNIRNLMAEDIARWKSTIAGLIARWQGETGSDI